MMKGMKVTSAVEQVVGLAPSTNSRETRMHNGCTCSSSTNSSKASSGPTQSHHEFILIIIHGSLSVKTGFIDACDAFRCAQFVCPCAPRFNGFLSKFLGGSTYIYI